MNEPQFEVFLEVASALNRRGITPILFGSLGLSRIIEQEKVNDIDIIVLDSILIDNFKKLEEIMLEVRFLRDPYYKHEFIRDSDRIGFEQENDLIRVGVNPQTLRELDVNGARFFELSAQDYLNVYTDTLARWEKKVESIREKLNALRRA